MSRRAGTGLELDRDPFSDSQSVIGASRIGARYLNAAN
jgi:hypothetical protein